MAGTVKISLEPQPLTHWDQDKMVAIFQAILSNGFSWMKRYVFPLECHWSLFLGVWLTICQRPGGKPFYPTLGCDIQGFRAMGLSVQYWPRWFQDFPAIWLAVPFGANGAHLGICTLPDKNLLCVWNKLFLGEIKFSQGELVLWSLYDDKLSLCRNQQMNRKI